MTNLTIKYTLELQKTKMFFDFVLKGFEEMDWQYENSKVKILVSGNCDSFFCNDFESEFKSAEFKTSVALSVSSVVGEGFKTQNGDDDFN